MAGEARQKNRKKLYFILALLVAFLFSSGAFAYAYTYTAAIATVGLTDLGDMATVSEVSGQPDWEDVLPEGNGAEQEILLPDGTGDETSLTPFPGSGANWEKVAELASDDWSTYVYTSSPPPHYRMDLYNVEDPMASSGAVIGVTVYFRVSGDEGSSSAYASAVIKTEGEVYNGDEQTLEGKEFVTKYYRWMLNPNTNAAWTWQEIEDLQVGIELKAPMHASAYCTQVFVVLDYEEDAIVAGNMPTGDLYEITTQPDYTGDLAVHLFLMNAGDLVKAYQYLNIKVELEGSVEDTYRLIALENGVVSFTLECGSPGTHTLSVTGGSYGLISAEPSEWEDGWSVTPELYYEVTQK